MRLINADIVQKHLNNVMNDDNCDPDFRKACFGLSIYLDTVPTEKDPLGIVQRGKWVKNDMMQVYICSACGKEAIEESDNCFGIVDLTETYRYVKTDYCPWCGAKMM